ncbi:PhoH family protein [Treponema pedis]|uniref:PhoH-like protein n=1 Tax=Treponema pedis TaxID=409322 RepID=A0A7S6WRN5_9SPIR|nr:PhoH family protein [Treponema pedis]QOW62065.1 PhoH family protein [Treponema pedis]
MEKTYTIVLKDKTVLSALCGANDKNLGSLETYLGAQVVCRGNELSVLSSDDEVCKRFQHVVDKAVNSSEITSDNSADYLQSLISTMDGKTDNDEFELSCIHIPRGIRSVYPKNRHQLEFINSIKNNDISFGLGAAGTGKTYIAVACALQMLMSHQVRKIVLTRPVVEAGESLGFLPGDLVQKITPYLRPLYDTIELLLPFEFIRQMEESNMFEVAPLAYMRGRTLHNSVVILDEAQNTTREQMKMFLTRMGEGSKLIITGDPSQSDITSGKNSGLAHAVSLLNKIKGIGIIRFSAADVVRHSLVQKIITAYERSDENLSG